jgi:hypothetical protein
MVQAKTQSKELDCSIKGDIMPKGKGTYGPKRGRPPKKKKKTKGKKY